MPRLRPWGMFRLFLLILLVGAAGGAYFVFVPHVANYPLCNLKCDNARNCPITDQDLGKIHDLIRRPDYFAFIDSTIGIVNSQTYVVLNTSRLNHYILSKQWGAVACIGNYSAANEFAPDQCQRSMPGWTEELQREGIRKLLNNEEFRRYCERQ